LQFVAECSEEYVNNCGSYNEFASNWTINMKATLSDGIVIEG
jgi:hypothetical protein